MVRHRKRRVFPSRGNRKVFMVSFQGKQRGKRGVQSMERGTSAERRDDTHTGPIVGGGMASMRS